jgi:hypothetical protein
MPSLAKTYIALIAALALGALIVVASRWNPANSKTFIIFFVLTMAASAMKIRLPGLKTTISTNFVFVLMGIALFSFGETVLIGLGGALVQSLWRPLQRPKPVQVFFNSSCLTVCAAAAFSAARAVPAFFGLNSMIAMMVVGAGVYVSLNTGLVSLVVALAEGRSLRQLWSSCYEWTFPYFLIGSAVAGLAIAAGQGNNWRMSLLVVPVMYFAYIYYRMYIVRLVLESVSSVSQSEEAALVGASHGS